MNDIAAEFTALDRMSTGELAERYAELHGQPCRTRHRAYLIRKIAWRLQANAEGDLSPRARCRGAIDSPSGWQETRDCEGEGGALPGFHEARC